MWPVVVVGVVTPIEVDVADVTLANSELTRTAFETSVVSKFVPLMLSAVPGEPMAGEKPVIVGAVEPTTNEDVLVALPDGLVTAITPVVAPEGTVAMISVAVADVTCAAVPLKVTAFCEGVALKPVPSIATVAPRGPPSGENSMITTAEAAVRDMDVVLPVASYLYAADPAPGSITLESRPSAS
jgi:hypothetical protein